MTRAAAHQDDSSAAHKPPPVAHSLCPRPHAALQSFILDLDSENDCHRKCEVTVRWIDQSGMNKRSMPAWRMIGGLFFRGKAALSLAPDEISLQLPA
jgi:hypothetical protein